MECGEGDGEEGGGVEEGGEEGGGVEEGGGEEKLRVKGRGGMLTLIWRVSSSHFLSTHPLLHL